MTDKFQHIKVPILDDEYFVTVVWGSWREAKKFIRGITEEGVDLSLAPVSHGNCWWHDTFKYNPVIFINNKVGSGRFYGTLSHEAVHAVDAIWDFIGEKSHGEAYAHCVGAIVRGVEEYIKPLPKKMDGAN